MSGDLKTLEAMIDFLGSAEFGAWQGLKQAAYLRNVMIQFRQQYPGDPEMPMLEILVAGFTHKVREEAQELARRN